ncbi:Glutaminyl-tRNA synthetase [Microbotryomycetes sp. JL221]|nr:Glutaminyl-tRNA synthetase [Microbotryomycetes sp. JL221]
MPPKLTPQLERLAKFFEQCGLTSTVAIETARAKHGAQVERMFSNVQLDQHEPTPTNKQATLCVAIAKDAPQLSLEQHVYLVQRVLQDQLKSPDQVQAAIKYLSQHTATPPNPDEFNKATGIGFTATPEQILERVRDYVNSNKQDLDDKQWQGISKATNEAKQNRSDLRWVNMLDLKQAIEQVYTDLYGPKPDPKQAAAAAAKAKKEKQQQQQQQQQQASKPDKVMIGAAAQSSDDMFAYGWLSKLHKPGGNPQLYPERMQQHLAATGGKVFTRFPPEPNGFLHIGHSKAIAVNFGYAKYHKGHCYLRYDDTNPEAEEQIYFDKILEVVRWLGYEPYKITHSSDHFQELYDLACELIKSGLAYTSNDTAEEINAQRGGKDHGQRYESKDRNKPIEQSLKEFKEMKDGKFKPGEMILRMKQDMSSGNPTMWDIIAYRVLLKPHHRTGTDWCIYPTYDFTHCLCDSFENITHSLCTTEFIGARTAYEWLCDALKVYKPRQSEYGRLSLEGTITSKRKLLRLVKEGHVSGWDDPRLYTLVALKRRGVPPSAIISFVSELGVSTNPSLVQLPRFEQTVRQHLEMTTPRLMMLLNPIKVVIENLPQDFYLPIEKQLHPKVASLGSNVVPFTRTIFIDSDDFKTEQDKDFFRLCPGATVGLLNVPCPITYVRHEQDSTTGQTTLIVCKYENDETQSKPPKPKSWIQWIAKHEASNSPVEISETRIFKRLFKSDDPASLGENYVKDIDLNSFIQFKNSLIEIGIWKVVESSLKLVKQVNEERQQEASKNGTEAPPLVDGLESIRFQGMRVAYFTVDYDSQLKGTEPNAQQPFKETDDHSQDKLVLNMIAPLKQDAAVGKKV